METFKNSAAITLHDTDELSNYADAIYVGVGGDVKLTTVLDTTTTFKNVAAGSTLYVACKLVFSTGTTATDLVALWND